MPERLQRVQEAHNGHRRPQSGPKLLPVSLPGDMAGRVQDQQRPR